MAIFKCKENWYISITQETLRKINALKRTRLGLAKVYNHIKFVKRALREDVIPVGFRRNFYIGVINKNVTQRKIGRILMKDTLDGLYGKLKRLKREEEISRTEIVLKLRPDEWELLEEKLKEGENKIFLDTRIRQMGKMSNLIQERDNKINECHSWKKKEDVEIDSRGRIMNLSKQELTREEENLLKKGLEFSTTTQIMNKLELSVNVEQVMKRLSLKDENLPKEVMKIMGSKVRENNNLPQVEREAMENLCKRKDIVITTSDKGKITIISDRSDYEDKLYNIILGGDYEILDKDPTNMIEKKLRKIAARIRKKTGNVKLYYKLIGEDTRWPGIFGNYKVHKQGNPMRVIISSYGTVLEKSGKVIKKILNRYVENWKNSNITLGITQMKEELEQKNLLFSEKSKLASIDVVSMFNNITVDKAFEIISGLVEKDSEFKQNCELDKEDFLELTYLALSNSYFKFENTFYKQVNGIPMGSGISPVVADLVMLDLEEKMSGLTGFKYLEWYRRFRDDGFIIWKGSRGEMEEFVEDLNDLDESGKIKFTMEFEKDGKLPFLDAQVTLQEGRVKFRIFEKPYSARMLLNFNSYQDVSIKRAVIAGEALRYLRISDEIEEDMTELKRKFDENGYPRNEVSKVIDATKRKWEKKVPKIGGEDKIYLSIDYPGKKKAKQLKKLGRKYGFKPSFKRHKTIGNKLNKTLKQNTNRDKGLIYSVKCKCGDEYIGETGKDIMTRMKGHKYSIRNVDMNNGLAVHATECNAGFEWDKVITLGWEGKWSRRKIKESLWIQRNKPKMNINKGWELRGIWN